MNKKDLTNTDYTLVSLFASRVKANGIDWAKEHISRQKHLIKIKEKILATGELNKSLPRSDYQTSGLYRIKINAHGVEWANKDLARQHKIVELKNKVLKHLA